MEPPFESLPDPDPNDPMLGLLPEDTIEPPNDSRGCEWPDYMTLRLRKYCRCECHESDGGIVHIAPCCVEATDDAE